MKALSPLVVFLFLFISFSFSQDEIQKPVVMKPVYFDISPPLREMVQRTDAMVDQSWKEAIVINKLNTVSNDNSVPDDRFVDPVRQHAFGDMMTSDTTIQNFDGISSPGNIAPPDPDGDVSPLFYMQVVNSRFAIYDKTGTKLAGPTNNSVIFSGLPHNSNDGDAIILYDENADRWLFSQFSLPNYPNGPFYENVAISQTNDPTGTWYRYQFAFDEMPDYPKLSTWVDGYYMTIRRFSAGAGNWLGTAVMALDRSKMLTGDPTAGMVKFNLPTSSEAPLTPDCDSNFPPEGTPCPVAYLTSTANATVRIYNFHTDWVTPSNSTCSLTYTLPITNFSYWGSGTTPIPQKGTTQELDAMSKKGLMFRMPFRKFNDHWSMLLNTTVNVNGVAGIRWMELRFVDGSWGLYQEGTYAPEDGNYRWMGSIAMDTTGNIALGFSISSSSMFPSIRYTGRLNGDPLGVMTIAEKGIINGNGSQTSASGGRWGDYSALNADPVEIGKFWYTQEYYASTSGWNWKTRVASFSFAGLFSAITSVLPNPVCSGDTVQLNVTPLGGSGTYTYSWSSLPEGFNSTLQSPKVVPSDTTKYIVTTSNGTTSRSDTLQVNVVFEPAVFAGTDTTVCWYVISVDLYGTATNYHQLKWTTNGTGTFADTAALVTTYIPSLQDKIAGFVDLKLIATSNEPCSGTTTSSRHVTFDVCTDISGQNVTNPELVIQPNPAKDMVAIAIRGINAGSSVLSIKSMDGKILLSEAINASATAVIRKIDLSGYARGIYFMQLKTGKKVITEKMIVK
jgi:hypothetical protein